MIAVHFLKFDKQIDETKKPTSAQINNAVHFNCTLKEDTDILNPTLKVHTDTLPVGNNYCYIPLFNRYYFITNWTSSKGLWLASLSVDVLASNKNAILDTNQYIMRSADTYDGRISDGIYPCKSEVQTTKKEFVSPIAVDFNNPGINDCFFVLTTSGGTSATAPATGMSGLNIYGLTGSDMNRLITWLNKRFPDEIFENLDILSNTVKAFVNPFQYIRSCKFIPIKITSDSNKVPLQYGYWDSGSESFGTPLSSTMVTKYGSIAYGDIRHPQAVERGEYLNFAPYTTYEVTIEPFGKIDLDSSLMADGNTIQFKITADIITGDATLQMKITDGTTYEQSSAPICISVKSNIAIEVPLYHHQYGADYLKKASDAAFSASSGYVGSRISMANNVIGGFSGGTMGLVQGSMNAATDMYHGSYSLFSGLIDGLQNNVRSPEYSGSPSSHLMRFLPSFIVAKYSIIVDEDNEHKGRPLMQVKKLGDLQGFTQCSSAEFSSAPTTTENQKVMAFLNGGFYIS